tara:strand:+ start:337 stop:582 length:246 start_codon:yes stop_codon:yes gene_type:complete
MLHQFILKNINLVSIVLFLVFFIVIIVTKPGFIFDKYGKPREFGLGYKNKTIIPIWLIVIFLAIISYLIVLFYLNYKKFVF